MHACHILDYVKRATIRCFLINCEWKNWNEAHRFYFSCRNGLFPWDLSIIVYLSEVDCKKDRVVFCMMLMRSNMTSQTKKWQPRQMTMMNIFTLHSKILPLQYFTKLVFLFYGGFLSCIVGHHFGFYNCSQVNCKTVVMISLVIDYTVWILFGFSICSQVAIAFVAYDLQCLLHKSVNCLHGCNLENQTCDNHCN